MFFPQRLATANYFGALGDSGRTSLVLTPGAVPLRPGRRPEPSPTPSVPTPTSDLRLFYTGRRARRTGANKPALGGARPASATVAGTCRNGVVRFSARVDGRPVGGCAAGLGHLDRDGRDSGHGRWKSVDLRQSPTDSTRWTASMPTCRPARPTRACGSSCRPPTASGAVGLDTADGDGYGVDAAARPAAAHARTWTSRSRRRARRYGITAQVRGTGGQPLPDQTVCSP